MGLNYIQGDLFPNEDGTKEITDSVESIAPKVPNDENSQQASVEDTLTKPGYPPAHLALSNATSIALADLVERFHLTDESNVKILGGELASLVRDVYEEKKMGRLYPELLEMHFPRMPFLISTQEDKGTLDALYAVDLDKLNNFRLALKRERESNREYFEKIRTDYIPEELVGLYVCLKEALNNYSKIPVEQGPNIKLGDKMSNVTYLTTHLETFLGLNKDERFIARGYVELALKKRLLIFRTSDSGGMYSINNDSVIREGTNSEYEKKKFISKIENIRNEHAKKGDATHKN